MMAGIALEQQVSHDEIASCMDGIHLNNIYLSQHS